MQRDALATLRRPGCGWVSVEWLEKLRAVQHLDDPDDRERALWDVPTPIRSQVESLRRAVKTLAREGLVEIDYRLEQTLCRHRIPRAQQVYADDRAEEWDGRLFLRCRAVETPGVSPADPPPTA